MLEEEHDKVNESDRFVLEEASFREEKEQTHATVAKAVGDKVSAAVRKRGGGQQWCKRQLQKQRVRAAKEEELYIKRKKKDKRKAYEGTEEGNTRMKLGSREINEAWSCPA